MKTTQNGTLLFSKKQFQTMIVGLIILFLGYFLMAGSGANSTPEGNFDPDYWNEEIFSVWRIRVAPFLVILGFVIQIYAIFRK